MLMCVYRLLRRHMFSCNYQHFLCVCVCVCIILPLKIINTGVAPGRPAAYSAWLSTMPQKWSHHPSIHPSLHPSVSLFLCDSRKGHRGLSRRQHIRSDQTKTESHSPSAKNLLSLLLFIKLSISLPDTIPVSVFSTLHTDRHTYILACVQSKLICSQMHTHTPGQPTTQPRIRPSFIDVCESY